MIDLDHNSGKSLYIQIYEYYKDLITSNRYPEKAKLPSVRFLAEDLGVSRNTVGAAYSQLAQEGYVTSRVGSGYIVEPIEMKQGFINSSSVEPSTELIEQLRTTNLWTSQDGDQNLKDKNGSVEYDFTYGNLESHSFPAQIWQKLTTEVLYGVEASNASRYPDSFGEKELRKLIAMQLQIHRGVHCHPAQIIIQAGTQNSLYNLLNLFDSEHDKIAFEEPGYDGVRYVFENAHFKLVAVSTWQSDDIYIKELNKSKAKIAYVTPSNQFPTGRVMQYQTRQKLLDWAIKNNAYILEDDYCREYRYNSSPLPSLQSLDLDQRVIYMGTFSKALSPALRLSYLVLPAELLFKWSRKFDSHYSQVPWLSQAVLQSYIQLGYWEKHLRKVQASYKRKYHLLLTALNEYMGSEIEIMENGSGLHLLVGVKDGRNQNELVELANQAGIKVYDTNRYWIQKDHPLNNFVLVGFSAIEEEKINPGIKSLAKAWF